MNGILPQDRVKCHGSCEKFFPFLTLHDGYCALCRPKAVQRAFLHKCSRAVNFLRGKPMVRRCAWTQWAANTLKLNAREMDSIIAALVAARIVQAGRRKPKIGRVATVYRLRAIWRDATCADEVGYDIYATLLDKSGGGADNAP